RSDLVRLAARLIIEEGLEGEATDALGREYYGRGAAPGVGYRNGHRTGRLKTAEGVVEYAAPQISDRAVPFRSRLREIIRGRSEELAVLAAWGVLADGHKVLLHLAPGTKEDTASCREFFQDLRRRGLPDPLLVVSDGAPGLIRAIEECFPRSARQRCLVHKLRNLQSKVPEDQWPEFKARAIACYQ